MTATAEQTRFGQAMSDRSAANQTLGRRVASGLATPQELQQYQNEKQQRKQQFNQMRAERTQQFAQLKPQERQRKQEEAQREFDRISNEMRSVNPNTPIWQEMRQEKLEVFHELDDYKNAANVQAYNERSEALRVRSEQRKQLDVAKNAPFNTEIPLVESGTDAPGSEEPGEDVMNPALDSRDLLKGSGNLAIRSNPAAGERGSRAEYQYAGNPPGSEAAASEAVNR